jgi:hypothetical chaperone protein
VLDSEGIPPGDINNMFRTGGSWFIPAVRRLFEEWFDSVRLSDGENFQSVAFGLALIGLEDNLEPWLARSVTGQEHCELGDDPG